MNPALAELIDSLAEIVAEEMLAGLQSPPPVELSQIETVAEC